MVGGADEAGDEVLAGRGLGGQCLALLVDQLGEVAAHLLDGPGDPAARPAAVPDHHARPVPEVVLVLARDAEQVADGVDGQRERELVDEVGGALRGEPVDEVVGQLLHPGRELGDPAGRERLADQPAQPGVVRRVDVQQMGHQLGLALAGDAGLALGVRGLVVMRRVLAQPLVGQGLSGIGVPGDQPGLHPAGQPRPVHRRVLAQPGVGRVGVGGELPGEQGGSGVGGGVGCGVRGGGRGGVGSGVRGGVGGRLGVVLVGHSPTVSGLGWASASRWSPRPARISSGPTPSAARIASR